MIKFFLFIFLLFFSTLTFSNELNYEEEIIFDLVDLNNDGFISYEEIEQLLNPIFETIDQSGDNKISKNYIDCAFNVKSDFQHSLGCSGINSEFQYSLPI